MHCQTRGGRSSSSYHARRGSRYLFTTLSLVLMSCGILSDLPNMTLQRAYTQAKAAKDRW